MDGAWQVSHMCPNRVEELETRVQELEASVEGLTDELVECKVRLRELENAVDQDLGFEPVGASLEGFDDPALDESDPETAEAPNTEGPENSDNTEESESGDIIVA